MNKISFIKIVSFASLLLGSVQTNPSFKKPDAGSLWEYEMSKELPNTNNSINHDDDQDEKSPELICLLFGNQACHTKCNVIARIYEFGAHGNCDQNQHCNCHIAGISSFFNTWEKKFHSDYVFNKIINNPSLFEQAQLLLAFPLSTADQYKKLLRAVLTPFQLSKLETRDDSLAAKFTQYGRVNIAAVKKYISDTLQKTWTGLDRSYLRVNYKEKLLNALKNANQGTLYNIIFRIRLLNNTRLENILQEFLRQNNMEEPKIEIEKQEDLDSIMYQAIVYEIIAQNDENNAKQSSRANSPTPINRSYTNPTIKSYGDDNYSGASAANTTPSSIWGPSPSFSSRFRSRLFPSGRRFS